MIVYGDRSEIVQPHAWLTNFTASVEGLPEFRGGCGHRDRARHLLIEWGRFHQAVLDRRWRENEMDDWGRIETLFAEAGLCTARLLLDENATLARETLIALVREIEPRLHLTHALELRLPEGYAFYALYPEMYAESARRWRARVPDAPLCVIGLRSIGTSLAAMVHVGAGAVGLPITVRPTGHPFSREIRPSRRLRHHVLGQPADTHFAIVDEGPGLSGSSFGGVADWLELHGVERSRLHFFASHGGDLGSAASPKHRRRWSSASRHVCDLGDVRRLEGAEDLSGGAWRAHLYRDPSDWPAVFRSQEKRKFLLPHDRLAKFVGCDRSGADKIARVRLLAEAGLSPRVLAASNGFIIERWEKDATPLDVATHVPRARVIGRLGAYLGFRARAFPLHESAAHTPPRDLLVNARHNWHEYIGRDDADAWRALEAYAGTFRPQRIYTDNRLHPWEWIVTREGDVLKTDAVDHATAHDYVGPQDLAWDVAGAIHEFDLDAGETELLLWVLKSSAPFARLTPEKLRFHQVCYLGFQLGYYAMAAEASAQDREERARLGARAGLYAQRLGRVLGLGAPASRSETPESLRL